MSKNEKKKIVATPELYDVIDSPVITEKANMVSAENKVIFYVKPCATKPLVKKAVEALFGVDVAKVNIINEKGKVKRFRGRLGKQKDYKKAIVTIAKGQQIDITATV